MTEVAGKSSILTFRWKWVMLFRERKILTISAICGLMALLGTGQDLADALINGYSFYFSESFSFKVYWALFIPFSGMLLFLSKQRRNRFSWMYIITGATIVGFLHIIATAFVLFLISGLFWDHTFHFSRLANYFFANESAKTLAIYDVLFFVLFRRQPIPPQDDIKDKPKFLTLPIGGKLVPVAVEDIQYIVSDRPYIAIHTAKKKYLYAMSLKQILEKLDRKDFFRVHRSSIVNLRHIAYFRSRSNGDYDIVMEKGHVIRMSRNFSKPVKKAVRAPQVST